MERKTVIIPDLRSYSGKKIQYNTQMHNLFKFFKLELSRELVWWKYTHAREPDTGLQLSLFGQSMASK